MWRWLPPAAVAAVCVMLWALRCEWAVECRGPRKAALHVPTLDLQCPRREATSVGAGGDGALVVGLVRELAEVTNTTRAQLAELNCKHGVPLDIIVGSVVGFDAFCGMTHADCAPVHLYTEPAYIRAPGTLYSNRVVRIAHVREVQRQLIRKRYPTIGAVVIIDFDMRRLPSNEQIVRKARATIDDPLTADVTCALGLERNFFGEEYYDSFATVFADSSFAYPRTGRLLQVPIDGERQGRILTPMPFGDFTAWDFAKYIRYAAGSSDGTFPVKSCFGGFAVYRGAAYFDEACTYEFMEELTPAARRNGSVDNLYVYAEETIGKPCEHVVLHTCLGRRGRRLAIDPAYETWWKGALSPPRREVLEVNEAGDWAVQTGAVCTFRPHINATYTGPAEVVSRLEAGGHVLYVHPGTGQLRVEDTQSGRVVWTPPATTLAPGGFQDNWYRIALVLHVNGELLLFQQVFAPNSRNAAVCRPFDDAPAPHCRILLWRTDGVGPGWSTLRLHDSGRLTLTHLNTAAPVTYWASDMQGDTEVARNYREMTHCIEGSGDVFYMPQRCGGEGVGGQRVAAKHRRARHTAVYIFIICAIAAVTWRFVYAPTPPRDAAARSKRSVDGPGGGLRGNGGGGSGRRRQAGGRAV